MEVEQQAPIVETVKKSGLKPGKITMDEVKVEEVELCFVTSTDYTTRTFFAQFCKFTCEELNQHNTQINEFCKKIVENKLSVDSNKEKPTRFHTGDILCAYYDGDGLWYRARVLEQYREKQMAVVMFVDYGNIDTVFYEQLISASSLELPELTRAPFGITCTVRNIDNLPQDESDRLLKALYTTYSMINVMSRVTKLQWLVEIPRHKHNKTFWSKYQPIEFDDEEDEVDGQKQVKKKPRLTPEKEEVVEKEE